VFRGELDDGARPLRSGEAWPPLNQSKFQERISSEIAVPVFDYKNHLKTDGRHNFIRSFTVT
jgi:hypothetical protein